MKKLLFFIIPVLASCIGEDIVEDGQDPEVRITNPIDSIQTGNTHTFTTKFLDNVGKDQTPDSTRWLSSDKTIATIDQKGVLNALTVGKVTITVTAFLNDLKATSDTSIFKVVSTPVVNMMNTGDRSGSIAQSSYTISGDFTLTKQGNGIVIRLESNYLSTGIPGLVLYLSNGPNQRPPNGVRRVASIDSRGSTRATGPLEFTVDNVGLFDYSYLLFWCEPFNIKIAHGQIN